MEWGVFPALKNELCFELMADSLFVSTRDGGRLGSFQFPSGQSQTKGRVSGNFVQLLRVDFLPFGPARKLHNGDTIKTKATLSE